MNVLRGLCYPSHQQLYRTFDIGLVFISVIMLFYAMHIKAILWYGVSVPIVFTWYYFTLAFMVFMIFCLILLVNLMILHANFRKTKISDLCSVILESEYYFEGWKLKCRKVVSLHMSRPAGIIAMKRLKDRESYFYGEFVNLTSTLQYLLTQDPKFFGVSKVRAISTRIKPLILSRLGVPVKKETSFGTCLNVVFGTSLVLHGFHWRTFKSLRKEMRKVNRFDMTNEEFLKLKLPESLVAAKRFQR